MRLILDQRFFFFSLPDDIRLPFPFFNLNYIGKPTCKNRKSREAVMPLLAFSLSLSLSPFYYRWLPGFEPDTEKLRAPPPQTDRAENESGVMTGQLQ